MVVGSIVEVTGGMHPRKGEEAIVTALADNIAIVHPVNADMQPIGECYGINAGLLTEQPSQTEIRRAKVKFREQHLADLKEYRASRPSNIRVIETRSTRRRVWKESSS